MFERDNLVESALSRITGFCCRQTLTTNRSSKWVGTISLSFIPTWQVRD